ncbi:MAG: sigma-54-dependent Fis family transcriptional regulator [Planctomycetes bacterium RBG_16_64_10]|nr:MAG: sigma-54-dependent Fis family transcriptional regulator [Planctomycetes bacterium RBG_16_64_10]
MVAYLVIREGSKWTDVFRLVPGEVVTIGRAPTNQIVIKDERCSRSHAEIFQSEGQWLLRDLESRNGTVVDDRRIKEDYPLQPGDVVRIGSSHLAFVHDLAKAFPDSQDLLRKAREADDEAGPADPDGASVLETDEPTEITHRTGQSRFLEPSLVEDEDSTIPKVGRAAAKLCRLAFELAQSTDEVTLANLALSGLFESTPVDAGAVMVVRNPKAEPGRDALSVVASRSDTEYGYQSVSNFLASTVIREGQAVLARNVMDDSALGIRDSKGEIHTTSVICAPLRRAAQVLGVIHLYSTDSTRALDPDDLEFTLAVADTVAVALVNLSRRQELAENLNQILDENIQLRERLGVESEIVGRSAAIQQVTQEISRAAPSRATVLIRGESGVGKELVARAVHFASPRRKDPFVCLNCAALSETLLESELFGHERGAFTGATDRKIGKFEAAHRGTLMLDEIGEMSPTIQAKFLRVLEGHPFERVGGSQAIAVDVRAIAATNRDLEKDVADGRFRRDLYFRLHVLEIVVPALRKRLEDVPILADYFLQRFRAETGRRIRGFTPRAIDLMLRYRWPGNIRELKNVIERAVVLARSDLIDCDDLTLSTISTVGDTGEMSPPRSSLAGPASLADMEREHIRATLRSTGWNKSQTAGILGIERTTLDRKIRRYSLVRDN